MYAASPDASPLARCGRALVVLLAAALVACWGHLTVVAITRHLFGVFSWKWWLRDQLLFSSVGYPLVFAAISILPIVVHVCWPRRFTLAHFAAFEPALPGR